MDMKEADEPNKSINISLLQNMSVASPQQISQGGNSIQASPLHVQFVC